MDTSLTKIEVGSGRVPRQPGLVRKEAALRLLVDQTEADRMRVHERINIDPGICHGQACIEGTRLPVHLMLQMLANGDTIEDLLVEYPSLTRTDILACLSYAATLAEEHFAEIDASPADA